MKLPDYLRKFKNLWLFVCCLLASCSDLNEVNQNQNQPATFDAIEAGFKTPPDSIQTSVYWYWMSDNISKEGVVNDLHAMKRKGINRAFIGNIGEGSVPYGDVKLFTDEWWDILHTALKTATELDIEIGIFNSPGWSQSGGPWIKPDQAMRYLASSEIEVQGPKNIQIKLPQPATPFQDVRVVAYKAPEAYGKVLHSSNVKIAASPSIKNIMAIVDSKQDTEVIFPSVEEVLIDFETNNNFILRSVVIYPAHRTMKANAEIQVKEDFGYRTLKQFVVDRHNDNLNVGFDPYGPVAISIPATEGKNFRLIFTDISSGFGLAEVELSPSPRVENYTEKTLAKMFQDPLPYWNEYQWPKQPEVENKELLIDPEEVKDISEFMEADGTLTWDVPAGKWVIMRTGMTPTGVKNGPASPEGTGLEVDKMSKEHVAAHFDAFLGEIMRRVPAEDRKTWKMTVEDSYETGGQNWTDGMIAKYEEALGYSPLPYLPVFKGRVVGSQEMSDRFLWDLRRFIADRIAYDYVAGLREVSHEHGLRTWLENYGHWGFPGEFLQYGGQSDEVAGEFWSEGELGDIENKAASSAAHIYGKQKVSAESFTAAGKAYARYPALMKQRGDRFFTEGINNTLLHVFIQQAYEDREPGVNAAFGNAFNRKNTWYDYLDLFIDYIKRSNFMLQQGKYVADVAYFIGEDAPKMTGVTDPPLPAGYSFDYINAEVIKERVKVEDGKMVLPDGMAYRLLVLPQLETIRPELLEKIKALVSEGAAILGPAPKRSPGLQNYPEADKEVKKLAAELWGDVDGKQTKSRQFGKGTVMSGMDMQTALDHLDIIPDMGLQGDKPVLYIHRTLQEGDIYFVSNQSEKEIEIAPEFRLTGKQPEYWDAITGRTRILPEFTQNERSIAVPLKLAPLQSAFIVFRNPAESGSSKRGKNFPEPQVVSQITSPWQVNFDREKRGPVEPVQLSDLIDWSESSNEKIKYYSGTAVYHNTFNAKRPTSGERLYLNLGDVKVMARVKVNGKEVGGVWTAPWRVDITEAVKDGDNEVEIHIVNTWVNRLIGDSKLPVEERKTWTNVNPYTPESPLEPSGLKGPVTLTKVKYE